MVTPAGGSPQVWAATVGYSGGIERFDPANGSSLGSLGYDVAESGHGNFQPHSPAQPASTSMAFITRRTQVVAVARQIRVPSFNMQLMDLATRRFIWANLSTTIVAISA